MLSTYRLQLHQEFGFRDAAEIVPYLRRLGVSHIYTSPILAACPGSTHGYDVVDPSRANPELGGEEGRRALATALRQQHLGHLLDFVPNHMGTGRANPYWEDLLTHGRDSRFARWFDVDWAAPEDGGRERIMVPILGDELNHVLERGELRLAREEDSIRLRYFDHSLPLDPASTANLPADPVAWSSGPAGGEHLRSLLQQQHYRLTFWRRAAKEINYRRFFDVNELAALRMEDPAVFDAVHARALEWIASGDVQGLRIDHIDGLRDPATYLDRLRGALAETGAGEIPVVVEKILSEGERLRDAWPVQGTTGYEFLNDLEAIFVDPEGFSAIRAAYLRLARVPGHDQGFQSVAWRGKLKILRGSLRADVRRLARQLHPILRGARPGTKTPRAALVLGLERLIAALPVYRTYVSGGGDEVDLEDRSVMDRAVERALKDPTAPGDMVEFIAGVLRKEGWAGLSPRERARRLEFIQRFQQTSGPATAKGVEDTALYQYVPLVSLNEVGGEPERPLRNAVARLHESSAARAARWPQGLIATNTHDTKRSADVRARLNVLSEIPDTWIRAVSRWRRMNRPLRGRAGRRIVPDPNTEYLLYQTIVGMWPAGAHAEGGVPGLPSDVELDLLCSRVQDYMIKAVREGKQRSTWTSADDSYEQELRIFIAAALDPRRSRIWLGQVGALVAQVARPGLWNALSRVTIHLTAPGTSDLYQGDELWNFTLVDPDNRRPVDYALRTKMLDQLEASMAAAGSREEFVAQLLAQPHDGRIKLYLTWRLLQERQARATLFAAGGYRPLAAQGFNAARIFAFAREGNGGPSITVAARLPVSVSRGTAAPAGAAPWSDTMIPLPNGYPGKWISPFTGRAITPGPGQSLPVAQILSVLPAELLVPAGET